MALERFSPWLLISSIKWALGFHTFNYYGIKIQGVKSKNVKVKNQIMRVEFLPIAGQHSNKQAIVPNSDRSQRKGRFQDTLRSQ
jgi:hypothetical protein